MHHIILLVDTSRSMGNRRIEAAKEQIIDILPTHTFFLSIVSIGNKPEVLVKHSKYQRAMIDGISEGGGVSNLGLSLSECFTLASSYKEKASILYVGDGMSTDDYNMIRKNNSSNVNSFLALLFSKETTYCTQLQRFEQYYSNDDDLEQLSDRLKGLTRK